MNSANPVGLRLNGACLISGWVYTVATDRPSVGRKTFAVSLTDPD
ncbi:MAG: hypothetical protein ACK6D0_06580 [Planctomyces sp.]